MKKQHNYQKDCLSQQKLAKRLSGMGLRRPNPDVVPIGVSPMARFSTMGCGQAAKATDFDSVIRGFESRQPSHKSDLQFSPLA